MSSPLTEIPGTLRPMLRLAVPVLIEQVLAMAVWFCDRMLAGHFLDKPGMAAITAMAYVLWMMYGMFSLVSIGATALIARSVGARDMKSARWATNQALLVGAVMAAAGVAIGLLWGDRVAPLLNLSDEAGAVATGYLFYVLPVLPMIMVEAVGVACLRAAGDAVSGLIIMAIANVVNVGVSCALVVGLGPLPAMGWKGIAIGTVCGLIVGGILFLWLLIRGRYGLRLQWRFLRPHGGLIRRLLRTGLPGGADMMSIIGIQLWFVAIINQLGDKATSAHGVAISIESMAFLPGLAFQTAAATLAGQYLGAKDFRKAGRAVWTTCLVGGGVMVSIGTAFFFGAEPLARLFVSAEHADVAELAAPLLRIIACAMPALAVTMILTGALRGAGDTRWPLVFSLVGLLGVRIPAAYWLAMPSVNVLGTGWEITGWDLGIVGAWYAMAADLILRAILVLTRISHGGWKRVRV